MRNLLIGCFGIIVHVLFLASLLVFLYDVVAWIIIDISVGNIPLIGGGIGFVLIIFWWIIRNKYYTDNKD